MNTQFLSSGFADQDSATTMSRTPEHSSDSTTYPRFPPSPPGSSRPPSPTMTADTPPSPRSSSSQSTLRARRSPQGDRVLPKISVTIPPSCPGARPETPCGPPPANSLDISPPSSQPPTPYSLQDASPASAPPPDRDSHRHRERHRDSSVPLTALPLLLPAGEEASFSLDTHPSIGRWLYAQADAARHALATGDCTALNKLVSLTISEISSPPGVPPAAQPDADHPPSSIFFPPPHPPPTPLAHTTILAALTRLGPVPSGPSPLLHLPPGTIVSNRNPHHHALLLLLLSPGRTHAAALPVVRWPGARDRRLWWAPDTHPLAPDAGGAAAIAKQLRRTVPGKETAPAVLESGWQVGCWRGIEGVSVEGKGRAGGKGKGKERIEQVERQAKPLFFVRLGEVVLVPVGGRETVVGRLTDEGLGSVVEAARRFWPAPRA